MLSDKNLLKLKRLCLTEFLKAKPQTFDLFIGSLQGNFSIDYIHYYSIYYQYLSYFQFN